MNLTNVSQFFNTTSEMMRDNNSLYNTGCIDEINKVMSECSQFKIHVINTMNQRFVISLVIMSILIFFQMWIKYRQPKFSQTQFWKEKIEYRIDLIIIILMFFNILYIFMM
jgi:hypothetical protein